MTGKTSKTSKTGKTTQAHAELYPYSETKIYAVTNGIVHNASPVLPDTRSVCGEIGGKTVWIHAKKFVPDHIKIYTFGSFFHKAVVYKRNYIAGFNTRSNGFEEVRTYYSGETVPRWLNKAINDLWAANHSGTIDRMTHKKMLKEIKDSSLSKHNAFKGHTKWSKAQLRNAILFAMNDGSYRDYMEPEQLLDRCNAFADRMPKERVK